MAFIRIPRPLQIKNPKSTACLGNLSRQSTAATDSATATDHSSSFPHASFLPRIESKTPAKLRREELRHSCRNKPSRAERARSPESNSLPLSIVIRSSLVSEFGIADSVTYSQKNHPDPDILPKTPAGSSIGIRCLCRQRLSLKIDPAQDFVEH